MTTLKPTINERLDVALGTEENIPATTQEEKLPAKLVHTGNPEADFNNDFEYARETLHNLMGKATDLTTVANYFATEKQDAKSVEAAAIAGKEARDTALALIDLHQRKVNIQKGGSKTGDKITQNNAVFVGTTGDLLKLTRDMNKKGFITNALDSLNQADVTIVETTATEINSEEEQNGEPE